MLVVRKGGQYGAFRQDTFKRLPMVLNESGNFTAFMDMHTNSYLFYNRGASILTMVAGMIGQEIFLTGVRKYLTNHAYSTVVTDDLWTRIDHEARATRITAQSIKEVMDFICKIFQPENLWHVWMTYYTPGAAIMGAQMLEPTASQELDLPPAARDEALICNRGQQGYFRVRYDDRNILKLAELMMNNHTALDPLERAQLILDTSPIPGQLLTPPGLATLLNPECSTSGVAIWWKMMEYLKKERNVLPLTVSLEIFKTLFSLKTQQKKNSTKTGIEKPKEYEKFMEGIQAWMTSLVDPYFLEHGWKDFGSSEESMMVHKLMLEAACDVLELPSCIKFSQDILLAWMEDPDKDIPLHPRGKIFFLSIAVDTMNERYDQIKVFIDGLYKIAKEKENLKQMRIPKNSISLLIELKMMLDRNRTEKSSPLEESQFQEHGNLIDVNVLELAR